MSPKSQSIRFILNRVSGKSKYTNAARILRLWGIWERLGILKESLLKEEVDLNEEDTSTINKREERSSSNIGSGCRDRWREGHGDGMSCQMKKYLSEIPRKEMDGFKTTMKTEKRAEGAARSSQWYCSGRRWWSQGYVYTRYGHFPITSERITRKSQAIDCTSQYAYCERACYDETGIRGQYTAS